jgi:thiamine transport system permease protein
MLRPGGVVLLLLVLVIGAALTGLWRAGGAGGADLVVLAPSVGATAFGAALQAGLSATASLVFGGLIALALARRAAFPGRAVLVAVLSTATVAPTIVIVFGVAAIHGRGGLTAAVAHLLGWPPPPPIFGLHGIVYAHVVLNAPFVARVLLAAFERVPPESARLAAALGFDARATFWHLDWPVIRREAPGLFGFVFLLCFTSFAVVLALGGGPANATLEVAIFQALRVEADFGRAAALASVQFGLCLAFVLVLLRHGPLPIDLTGAARSQARPDREHVGLRRLDTVVLAAAALLLAPPILSVLVGFASLPAILTHELLDALVISLALATVAGTLAAGMALMIAQAAVGSPSRMVGAPTALPRPLADGFVAALVGLPPYAFVAGLFVLLRGSASLSTLGLILVPMVNALMALPFAYRLIAPAVATAAERHGRVAAMLGLSAARRREVDRPLIRPAIVAAFAFSAALSLGDYGVVALFGGGRLVTLPMMLAERLGAYRIAEAGAVALVMLTLSGALLMAADRYGRGAPARMARTSEGGGA